uniref:VacJ family lipoprotein n=1 Tax=uncultured Alphaproteobacteria bacterium TaxID=91750 RepID=A0A6G8F316_9PROT|nr:hypothetical protein PlAlph_5490 [uncultured Alphaproteobacteria bacterium]
MLKYTVAIAALLSAATADAYASEQDSWLETYNRSVFGFNMQVDRFVLKPVAKGYRAVTNQDVRNRVSSFISNVNEPASAVNHTLQGSVTGMFNSIARFAINSTLGLGGMFDVAEGWGLPKKETGFDETMAHYCVPDGPLVMLPFFGPFTVRSMVGYTVDGISTPVYWAAINDKNYSAKISYSYAALTAISARERSLDLLDDLERNSVDFYSTMRSAYLQNRQKYNSVCQSANTAPSYDFDFDDSEDADY